MSYRIFMTVKRDMTDNTAVCVFPWEKYLLEEVHGGNAQEVSIEEMCSMKGAASVKEVKLKPERVKAGSEKPLTLRQQLQAMCQVPADEDPVNDLGAEWNRLTEKYGMHRRIELPIVEKVYGNLANFRRFALQFKGATPPKGLDIEELTGNLNLEREEKAADEKPIAEMTREELITRLKKEEIAYPKNASVEKLRELAETALA